MTTACPAKKILIVEDDFERETFAVILAGAGYRTEQARTAGQAMQSLIAEKPDLILLDMLLPGADDGWSLLNKIRRNPVWRSIPVVIVTGLRFASDEWGRSLGAVSVLQEPITPDELLEEISRQVD
jgi:twitching motility two-component system response regulator PilH